MAVLDKACDSIVSAAAPARSGSVLRSVENTRQGPLLTDAASIGNKQIERAGSQTPKKAGRSWLIFKIKDPVQTHDHKDRQKINYLTT